MKSAWQENERNVARFFFFFFCQTMSPRSLCRSALRKRIQPPWKCQISFHFRLSLLCATPTAHNMRGLFQAKRFGCNASAFRYPRFKRESKMNLGECTRSKNAQAPRKSSNIGGIANLQWSQPFAYAVIGPRLSRSRECKS